MTDAEAKKPVLLLSGGSNQISLCEVLAEDYRLAFLNSQVAETIQSLGAEVIRLEKYADDGLVTKAENKSIWYATQIVEGMEHKTFLGLSDIASLKEPELGEWFPGFLHAHVSAALARIGACSRLHLDEHIAGIIVHEDVTDDGRILAQFGIANGIPTVHIPHANHFLAPDANDIHRQVTANFIGAYGAWMRDWYVSCGVPDANIRLVGNLSYDWLYDDTNLPSREHARRALGFAEDDFIIAYGTTWAQSTNVWGEGQAILDADAVAIIEAMPSIKAKLIVKMHPGEPQGRESLYRELMLRAGVEGAIMRGKNEFALIASDLLLTQGSSNIAVQSHVLGTPVAEVFQKGTRYPVKYGIPGFWAAHVDDALPKLVEEPPEVNETFIRDMNYDHDGKAVERAVEYIKELTLGD